MESPVEIIKNKLPISEVVGSYLKLEKAGVNMKARCPFHNERTPSFFVSPERGTFHCFGCNRGGDIFTFVEEIEGIEFKEALRVLADRSGVTLLSGGALFAGGTGRLRAVMNEATLFYRKNLLRSTPARKYLRDRGVSEVSEETFQIGFALTGWHSLCEHLRKKNITLQDAERVGLVIRSPKAPEGYYDRFRGRLIFPFFDQGGRPIGFSARILPGVTEDAENQGKYINSPETDLFHKSKALYGINEAHLSIRESDKTILVEGQLDVIMAHQAGSRNVVGVSGTAFTQDHISTLRRLSDNLLVVLDSDSAGFRASDKVVRMALAAGMHVSVLALPASLDPAGLIEKDQAAWQKVISREMPFVDYVLTLVKEAGEDKHKSENAIREYLYPALGDMYNEIEKDRALQDTATLLGVTPDAVRKDFDKWQATKGAVATMTQTDPGASPKDVPPPLEMVATRLWGMATILGTSTQLSEQELSQKIWADLRRILGGELFVTFEDKYNGLRKEDLIFESEIQYPDRSTFTGESALLFSRLNREVLKLRFSEAMESLRLAEAKGDEKKMRESLALCQDISKDLSQS